MKANNLPAQPPSYGATMQTASPPGYKKTESLRPPTYAEIGMIERGIIPDLRLPPVATSSVNSQTQTPNSTRSTLCAVSAKLLSPVCCGLGLFGVASMCMGVGYLTSSSGSPDWEIPSIVGGAVATVIGCGSGILVRPFINRER